MLDGLKSPQDLTHFSLPLMKRLEGLTKARLQESSGKYLNGREIDTLLKRRDKILKLYQKLTAERGPSITYQ